MTGPPPEAANCDRQIIHLPGSVQPHGVLFVLESERLQIQQVSANVGELLGESHESLVGKSLLDLVEERDRDEVRDTINRRVPLFSNPLTISLCCAKGTYSFDGIAHWVGDTIVLELEDQREGRVRGDISSRSIEHYFTLTSQTLTDVSSSLSIGDAARLVCERLREFTGFDRVMFYLFAPDFHGEVIGEAKREDLEPFLGLHYPASDIPKQARDMYVKNLIRLIADVHAEPSPLYPPDRILDMSGCVLRPVSPIHVEYLKNMGVVSSMSISMVEGDRLWALLACHHYDGPRLVPYSIRVSCVHFAMVMSAQLRTLHREFLARDRSDRRQILNETAKYLAEQDDFIAAVRERAGELMRVVDADGLALVHNDRVFRDGACPDAATIQQIHESIETERGETLFYTDCLVEAIPGVDTGDSRAAGLLSIPFSHDWKVAFFRVEQQHVVRWGGDPNKAVDPARPLTPRHSFEEWKETVRNRSREWTEVDIQIGEELSSALLTFVLQQNLRLEKLNSDLVDRNKEVQQFAYSVSHDLKSPLVTITGWIGMLEDDVASGNLEEARRTMDRIRRASERMGSLIEDLLSFSRIGRMSGTRKAIDMTQLFTDLEAEFELRLREAGFEMEMDDAFPDVVGYSEEIYRVFHNLIDNAIKYGGEGEKPTISIRSEEMRRAVRFSVKDNGNGIEPQYQERIFELFQRLNTSTRGTGLGLASVAKIAQLHRGKFGVNSIPGEGAEFWIELPKYPVD